MAWNENGNGKKILTGNITKIWEQEGKAISPFPKIGNGMGREGKGTVIKGSRSWELGSHPAKTAKK